MTRSQRQPRCTKQMSQTRRSSRDSLPRILSTLTPLAKTILESSGSIDCRQRWAGSETTGTTQTGFAISLPKKQGRIVVAGRSNFQNKLRIQRSKNPFKQLLRGRLQIDSQAGSSAFPQMLSSRSGPSNRAAQPEIGE